MATVVSAAACSAAASPMRSAVGTSTATNTSAGASTSPAHTKPSAPGMNARRESMGLSCASTHVACLPSARRACATTSWEPRQSPSGLHVPAHHEGIVLAQDARDVLQAGVRLGCGHRAAPSASGAPGAIAPSGASCASKAPSAPCRRPSPARPRRRPPPGIPGPRVARGVAGKRAGDALRLVHARVEHKAQLGRDAPREPRAISERMRPDAFPNASAASW